MHEKKYKLNKRSLAAAIIVGTITDENSDIYSREQIASVRLEAKRLAQVDILFMKMISICFKEKPFTINELKTALTNYWHQYEEKNYPEGYTEKFNKYLDIAVERGLKLDYFLEQEDV